MKESFEGKRCDLKRLGKEENKEKRGKTRLAPIVEFRDKIKINRRQKQSGRTLPRLF